MAARKTRNAKFNIERYRGNTNRAGPTAASGETPTPPKRPRTGRADRPDFTPTPRCDTEAAWQASYQVLLLIEDALTWLLRHPHPNHVLIAAQLHTHHAELRLALIALDPARWQRSHPTTLSEWELTTLDYRDTHGVAALPFAQLMRELGNIRRANERRST